MYSKYNHWRLICTTLKLKSYVYFSSINFGLWYHYCEVTNIFDAFDFPVPKQFFFLDMFYSPTEINRKVFIDFVFHRLSAAIDNWKQGVLHKSNPETSKAKFFVELMLETTSEQTESWMYVIREKTHWNIWAVVLS